MPTSGPPDDFDSELPDDDEFDAGLENYFQATPTEVGVASATPDRIGDYRILRSIGDGAMGNVYLAEETRLSRRVALKILKPELTASPDAVTRFRIEAESVARLKHPGIVQIFAMGEADGQHYIAMELIEGSPLQEVIGQLRAEGLAALNGSRVRQAVSTATHRVSRDSVVDEAVEHESSVSPSESKWERSYVDTVCRLVVQVADALQHAHDKGVIHRDVKPSNILVLGDGTAVLTDFGLARAESRPGVTQQNTYLGTPHYSSPEQAKARQDQIDHRTDIFSLGVTLYELLTLRLPFEGTTSIEVLDKIREVDPPNPRRLNRKVPRDLMTILLKALEKDRDRRYANAGAFAADLRAFLSLQPIAARRTSVVMRGVKLARRHPVASAALVVVVASSLIGKWVYDQQPGYLFLEYGPEMKGSDTYVDDVLVTRAEAEKGLPLRKGFYSIRVELVAESKVWFRNDVEISQHENKSIDVIGPDNILAAVEQGIQLDELGALSPAFKATLLSKLDGEPDAIVRHLSRPDFTEAEDRIDNLKTLGRNVGELRTALQETRVLKRVIEGEEQQIAESLGLAEKRWEQATVSEITDAIDQMTRDRGKDWEELASRIVDAAAPTPMFRPISAAEGRLRRNLCDKLWAQAASPEVANDAARLFFLARALQQVDDGSTHLEKLIDTAFSTCETLAQGDELTIPQLTTLHGLMNQGEEALLGGEPRDETRWVKVRLDQRILAAAIAGREASTRRVFEDGLNPTKTASAIRALEGAAAEARKTKGSQPQAVAIDAAAEFLKLRKRFDDCLEEGDLAEAKSYLQKLSDETELEPIYRRALGLDWLAKGQRLLDDAAKTRAKETALKEATKSLAAVKENIRLGKLAMALDGIKKQRSFEDLKDEIERAKASLHDAVLEATNLAESELRQELGKHDGEPSPRLEKLEAAARLELETAAVVDPTDRLRNAWLHLLLDGFDRVIEELAGIEGPRADLLRGRAHYCVWFPEKTDEARLREARKCFASIQPATPPASEIDRTAHYWLAVSEIYLLPKKTAETTQEWAAGLRRAREHLEHASGLDYAHAHQLIGAVINAQEDQGAIPRLQRIDTDLDAELPLEPEEVFGIWGGYRRSVSLPNARGGFLALVLYEEAAANYRGKDLGACLALCKRALEHDESCKPAINLQNLAEGGK